ncbi:MAG: hypothetical protein R2849_03690 [Thermomicrobiales bacterium]
MGRTDQADGGVQAREGASPERTWPIANGLIVGALAGLIASGLMLWIGRTWGGSILAQLLAERTTAELPLAVVRDALTNLEENAKPVALIGITIGQIIAAALGAVLYGRFAGRTFRDRVVGAAVLSGAAWLVLSVVAAPVGGIGLFAADSALGVGDTQLNFVITSVAYGALVAALVPWPRLAMGEASPERRTLLKVAGLGALALPAIWATRYIGMHANRLRNVADTGSCLQILSG